MPCGLEDARAFGDVVEGAVALVAVERVGAAGQPGRTARDRDALVAAEAGIGRGRLREIEVDVVGDEEIEPSVAVVVEEGGARAPSRAWCGEAGAGGDVGERAVAVVAKQPVLAVERDEQVAVAVVVVVGRGSALAPAADADAGLRGHVLERAVALCCDRDG